MLYSSLFGSRYRLAVASRARRNVAETVSELSEPVDILPSYVAPDSADDETRSLWISHERAVMVFDVILWSMVVILIILIIRKCQSDKSSKGITRCPNSIYRNESRITRVSSVRKELLGTMV
ncbi:hypothetical protein AAVH_19840 [Aphelenchoides avenae]|nr:hypothetical protein AAVH_19840 [Aphelenchus avenae]